MLTASAIVAAGAAHAEVWMVKSSNALGCQDRQTLLDLDAHPATKPTDGLPKGCILLYSGERLLEQTGMGEGFTKYLKGEREDGSILFVRASDVVSDPGIGSPSDNRANR